MQLDWKKIGIIAMFAVAVFLFGFFIYYFFWRPIVGTEQPANTNQPTANVNGQLPGAVNINGRMVFINANTGLPETDVPAGQPSDIAQGGLTKATMLADEPSYYAVKSPTGELIYYNPNTGKFYRVSADGKISEFSNKIFHNVSDVTWSNNREKAILEYPDGANIIYDFQTNKQITLPNHWQEFSFSANDQQLAFKSVGLDVENRFLSVAKYDGSGARTLEAIGDKGNQFAVNWSPNNQMVATFIEGRDAERSNVYFVGLNNENFKLMVVEGRGFQGQWSTAGDKMIYSVYNSQSDYKPQLWVADASPSAIGENRRKIDLTTWADKCAFADNNRVFCATPIDLPIGAALDPKIANTLADQIYEINLQTGAKKLIALPEGNHTVGEIIVGDDGNLFFTDKNDNRIYKIKL